MTPSTGDRTEEAVNRPSGDWPGVGRRPLLKALSAGAALLVGSGVATAGDDGDDDSDPGDDVELSRVPHLDLETLEAELNGETLQATSFEDRRPGSTSYVGEVTGHLGAGIFAGVSLLEGETEQPEEEEPEEIVAYLCDGEIGSFPELGISLSGDYEEGGVTLAGENNEIKLAMVDREFLGAATLADEEPLTFLAAEATDESGMYWAETEDDGVLQWIVLPDGRQRGSNVVCFHVDCNTVCTAPF